MNHHENTKSLANSMQDEAQVLANEEKLTFLRNCHVDTVLKNILIEMQEEISAITTSLEKLKKPGQRPVEWLTSSEVQHLLGISKRTLQVYRNKNYISFVRFNGIIRYNKKQLLEELKKAQKNQ